MIYRVKNCKSTCKEQCSLYGLRTHADTRLSRADKTNTHSVWVTGLRCSSLAYDVKSRYLVNHSITPKYYNTNGLIFQLRQKKKKLHEKIKANKQQKKKKKKSYKNYKFKREQQFMEIGRRIARREKFKSYPPLSSTERYHDTTTGFVKITVTRATHINLVLTDTLELPGVLVPYPEDGMEAKDQRLPSHLKSEGGSHEDTAHHHYCKSY